MAAELESISQAYGGLSTFAETLCHQHWLLLLVADVWGQRQLLCNHHPWSLSPSLG